MSSDVEEAMTRVLGAPTTCPHGNPIPGSDYLAPDAIRLVDVTIGQSFTVSRIPEELEFAAGMLDFLEQTHLVPGGHGTVTSTTPDGEVVVNVSGNSVAIVPFASSRILVTL